MLALLRSTAVVAAIHTSGVPTRGALLRGGGATQPRMMFNLLGGMMKEPGLISPDKALPGRPTPMSIPDRHFVLGNKMQGPWPAGHKVAVFANGCFWGSEKGIWRLPGDGIYTTAVGYAAGFTPNPTYEEACSGQTGSTEAVQVVYGENKNNAAASASRRISNTNRNPPSRASSLDPAGLLPLLSLMQGLQRTLV